MKTTSSFQKSPGLSKRVALKDELEAMITKEKAGARLPSYSEMIRRYGVGQTTIDHVLQELTLAGKVERIHGKGLFVSARSKQLTVGLAFSFDLQGIATNAFYQKLMEKCRESAALHGRRFAVYLNVNEGESQTLTGYSEFIEDVESGKLCGAVLVGIDAEPIRPLLYKSGVPHVVFSRYPVEPPFVSIDASSLIIQGVDSLVSCGCRRIGLFTDVAMPRFKGGPYKTAVETFESTLGRHGLDFIAGSVIGDHLEWMDVPESQRETNMEMGYRIATEAFGGAKINPMELDGLIITDDSVTLGVLHALERLGVKNPEHIRIATHANSNCPIMHHDSDKLILLEVDPGKLVQSLFEELDDLIADRGAPRRGIWISPTPRIPEMLLQ